MAPGIRTTFLSTSVKSNPVASADQRVAFLSQALTLATDVYKEKSRILALLEDKAQKTAGIAGIFLAAAFAFLRRESIQDLKNAGGSWGMGLFILSVVAFLGCMLASGLVLWVRQLQLPPNPIKALSASDKMLADPNGPSDAQRENHVRDLTRSWNHATQEQDRIISDKSIRLLIAQSLLLCGIIAAAGLLGLLVFSSTPVPPANRIQLIPASREAFYGRYMR